MKDDLSLDYAMMINDVMNLASLTDEFRGELVNGIEYCQDVTVCRHERSDFDGLKVRGMMMRRKREEDKECSLILV